MSIWRRICSIALHEDWMIGWVDAPIEQALTWKTCPKVHWLGKRSTTRYLADPFAWPGDASAILCEAYDFASHTGRITRLTLRDDAVVAEAPVKLPLPGHLSFPFLFSHGGGVYCIPESGAARCLKILRWENDAFREFATPLPQVAAADGVLFEYAGMFWIAYTDTDIGLHDNLNLCFASSLAGPWRMHPGNPVKRDLRSSRGGGTPFASDGSLYRPAQDCSKTYGGSIRIMRIAECTPERYREEEVTAIAPEPGMNPHGFHTLSAWGDRCLVDGKRMMFSLPRLFAKIKRRLGRA